MTPSVIENGFNPPSGKPNNVHTLLKRQKSFCEQQSPAPNCSRKIRCLIRPQKFEQRQIYIGCVHHHLGWETTGRSVRSHAYIRRRFHYVGVRQEAKWRTVRCGWKFAFVCAVPMIFFDNESHSCCFGLRIYLPRLQHGIIHLGDFYVANSFFTVQR